MTPRIAALTGIFAAALSAWPSLAAPPESTLRVETVKVPRGTDARVQAALQSAVEQQLSEAHLEQALAGYALSPSLIQLRRYAESGRVKLVCIVGLAVKSDGALVADVRGNAATQGATATEAIDAATRAAVARLPSVLAQLRDKAPTAPVASR